MKYIVGIGNPGKEYEKTRHNVGFMALDRFVQNHKNVKWKKDESLKALVALADEDFTLIKPYTYVNSTGQCVAQLASRYDVNYKDLLVVTDDVNLQFGKLRLRPSGSAGGHHGLESVIEALGSTDFPRLRIGVGNEKMPKDLTGFVLEEFSKEEKDSIEEILNKSASVGETWARSGFDPALKQLSQLLK